MLSYADLLLYWFDIEVEDLLHKWPVAGIFPLLEWKIQDALYAQIICLSDCLGCQCEQCFWLKKIIGAIY